MFRDIISLFYPALCQVCGKKTGQPDQNLCEDCLKKIKKRLPPFCMKCGRQLPGEPRLEGRCPDCKKEDPYYDRALSAFCYEGILKNLVHDFKYKKMTSLVKEFVELTLDFMNVHGMDKSIDLVLCIPMHPARLLKREINTSHILARALAKKLNIQYSSRILKKRKNTPPQSRLKRNERINNIKGSFSLRKKGKALVQGKNILLVDDLFTTGSTVNECSMVLKEASSGHVEVITLARGGDKKIASR